MKAKKKFYTVSEIASSLNFCKEVLGKNKTVDYLSLSLDEKCDIVKEVIEVIYCWKPIRTELCLEIHNKLTGETCTYYLDSYHKKVLSIEKISSNVEL